MPVNILIVDDSSLTRKAIKRIIQMVDVDIGRLFEAANGLEALEMLDKEKVDLVIADLNMPQMDGLEMIHHMKQTPLTSSIPVVVVSTESSTTRIKSLVVEGITDYLHKPFTPEEFRQILATNLE